MYTYHLKNILESNGYNNEVVIAKLKAWGCTCEKEPLPTMPPSSNIWIHGWREQLIPPHAPLGYLDLIQRLDDNFEYEYSGETFKPISRVQHSGRIYTTIVSDKRKLCFQAQKSGDRALFTWKGKSLKNFDVSASQLRIALALRGTVIPFDRSPWDDFVVAHSAMDALPSDIGRTMKKTLALLMVRGNKNPSFINAWNDKIGAPIAVMPKIKKFNIALKQALERDFPDLSTELEIFDKTPDGYKISRKSKIYQKHDIQCRSLHIKTSYREFFSEPPQVGNLLEAMEAYVLRQVIRSLPTDVPVLTCHDQIYVLPEFKELISTSFELEIRRLTAYA